MFDENHNQKIVNIIIKPKGRMANQMFQLMVALSLTFGLL
jgi:hypothetical protein